MNTSTVTLTSADGPVPAYEALPESPAKAGVIVIQEAFGINDHIQDVTRRFAAEGWHAVTPHLFHRTGSPILSYDDFPSVMPHLKALTGDGLLNDIDASLTHLAQAGIPSRRVGIVGFCMGGSVVVFACARRTLGAGVTFYGSGILELRWDGVPALLELAPTLQAPWLGLYGDLDQGIPVEQVEQLREAAGQATVPTEVVRYANAGHGFHCDQRPAYHPDSAHDGWRRTVEWFSRYLSTE